MELIVVPGIRVDAFGTGKRQKVASFGVARIQTCCPLK